MNYIDIPAKQILEEMEDQVKSQVDAALKTTKINAEVERLEWNAEGIRIWLKSADENTNNN